MKRPLAVVLLAVLVLGAAAYFLFLFRRDERAFVSAMDEMESRAIAARLPFPAKYKPLRHIARGRSRSTHLPLIEAAARLERAVNEQRSPENLRAYAAAQLLLGDANRAIVLIEEQSPNDAASLAVLSAAYLQRAATPRDAVLALDAAENGWDLERTPELTWNRALALDACGLRGAARDAWNDYLALDRGSPWAVEARTRIAALSASTASHDWQALERSLRADASPSAPVVHAAATRHPQRLRTLIEEQLLGDWAESGDTRLLERARKLSLALGESGSVAQSSISRAPSLIEGHRLYAQARRSRVPDPAEALRRAHELLAAGGSPFAARARVQHAYALFLAGRYEDALAAVRNGSELERDSTSVASSQWVEGLCLVALGAPQRGLERYVTAAATFHRLGERGNAAAVDMVIAEALRHLGSYDEAWGYQLSAMKAIDAFGDAERFHTIVTSATHTALRDGMSGAAAAFQRVVVSAAERDDAPPRICDALVVASEVATRRAAPADAQQAIAGALRAWARIGDETVRQRSRGAIITARGLALAGEPRAAVATFTAAIDVANRRNDRSRLPRLHLLRGQVQATLGDLRAADADFTAGIAEAERQRAGVGENARRITFLDVHRSLYEEAIRVRLDLGDTQRAFLASEQMHAGVAAVEWETIRTAMAPSTVVVKFDVLPGSLIVWTATRDGLRVQRRAVAASELSRSADLFDLLFRDVALPAADGELVIVPDGILHTVAFPGLVDRRANRHLIEHCAVAIAPNVAAVARPPAPAPALSDVLIVRGRDDARGSPVSWTAETKTIRRLLPQAIYADDVSNTRDVLARIREHGTVHIAAHAVAAAAPSGTAALLLGGRDHADSVIYAEDVSAAPMPKTSLVVLAGCATAAGRVRSEGAQSLARAFLRAGVPNVIAAVTPVPDEATAELFERFYASWKGGQPPLHALREAQLEAIRRGRPRTDWESFQFLYGIMGP